MDHAAAGVHGGAAVTRAIVLPTVVRDNNEQLPLEPFVYRILAGSAQKLRLPTRDASMDTADYSLPGLEKMVAVERKSIADLWGTCFGRDPHSSVGEARKSLDRFRREMSRLQWLARKWILVEGSKASLMAYARERYEAREARGKSPEECVNSLLDILAAIEVDYGVTVVWSGGREGAEAWLGRVLWRIWDQHTGGEKARTVRARGLGIEELPWLADQVATPPSGTRRFAEAGGMPLSTSAAEMARRAARRCR